MNRSALRFRFLLLIAASVAAAATGAAAGDPPAVSRLDPPGARRGSEVVLIVEGDRLGPTAELIAPLAAFSELVRTGELAPSTRRAAFKLKIDARAALGRYPLRVRTEDGISNPLVFLVGGFPEVKEAEPNDTPETAQTVELPFIANGRASGTDTDCFRFRARAGTEVVVEVEARRIGSALDPTLRLLRADGYELALSDDPPGLEGDCRISYKIEHDGEYVAEVHDALYAGRNPDFFRLKVGSYAFADGIFPLGGRAGTRIQVEFVGGNLPEPASTWVDLDPVSFPGLIDIALPAGIDRAGALPFPFRVGLLPEFLESAEPQESSAGVVAAGATVNGVIAKPGENDRYPVSVEPGETLVFEIEAARLGSWLDPLLALEDEDGARLALADDAVALDPRLEYKVPGDKKRLVAVVSDLHRRGGPAFAYRLTIRRKEPDFSLRLASDRVTVPAGGTGWIEVDCARRDYGGPVRLEVSGLPPGFAVKGGDIPAGGGKGILSLQAPGGTAQGVFRVEVTGVGGGADHPILRRGATEVVLAREGKTPLARLRFDEICLATARAQELRPVPAIDLVEVPAGTAVPVAVRLNRLEGFETEVRFAGKLTPPGVGVEEGKAAKDAIEGTFRLRAAPNAGLIEGDVAVEAVTGKDKGERRFPLPVFRARVVEPFTVEVATNRIALPQGGRAEVHGRVLRRPAFQGSVFVRADGLPGGVSAREIEVAGDARDFTLVLNGAAEAAAGRYGVRLVAKARFGDPKKPVERAVAPLQVEIEIVPPAPVEDTAAPETSNSEHPPPRSEKEGKKAGESQTSKDSEGTKGGTEKGGEL